MNCLVFKIVWKEASFLEIWENIPTYTEIALNLGGGEIDIRSLLQKICPFHTRPDIHGHVLGFVSYDDQFRICGRSAQLS